MEHDAVLKHAKLNFTESGVAFLTGLIYTDSKTRWPDGTSIYTSYLQEAPAGGGNGVWRTLNTKYLVEFQ